MKTNPLNPIDIEIARNFRGSDYQRLWEDQRPVSLARIADAIQDRFEHRFLVPASEASHGFASMALVFLSMEAYASFIKGWPDSRGRCRAAFQFIGTQLERYEIVLGTFDLFDQRNGLLHQGESRNGWRIHRMGGLLNHKTKVINAKAWVKLMRKIIHDYRAQLVTSDVTDPIWRNAKLKLDSILDTCK